MQPTPLYESWQNARLAAVRRGDMRALRRLSEPQVREAVARNAAQTVMREISENAPEAKARSLLESLAADDSLDTPEGRRQTRNVLGAFYVPHAAGRQRVSESADQTGSVPTLDLETHEGRLAAQAFWGNVIRSGV